MMTEEDEAFFEIEKKQAADANYVSGWNSALELVATKLIHDHKQAFGADTLASIAAYIKEFKK